MGCRLIPSSATRQGCLFAESHSEDRCRTAPGAPGSAPFVVPGLSVDSASLASLLTTLDAAAVYASLACDCGNTRKTRRQRRSGYGHCTIITVHRFEFLACICAPLPRLPCGRPRGTGRGGMALSSLGGAGVHLTKITVSVVIPSSSAWHLTDSAWHGTRNGTMTLFTIENSDQGFALQAMPSWHPMQ